MRKPIEPEGANKANQLSLGRLLGISFILFNLGPVIEQTFRWSNHWEGFLNGALHILFFGIPWAILILPWSLLIHALYQWQGWQRFRAHWILAPAAIAFLGSLGSLATNPPTASARFSNFAGIELPADLQDLHYHFSDGGVSDYGDTYYFETSPAEIDRLIAQMELTLNDSPQHQNRPMSVLPGCPDFRDWANSIQYRRYDDSGRFYYLLMDDTKTRVYIFIGSI